MTHGKKAISFFFIFIFCYSGLRPTFPMFNYFLNYDYIAEILCINKEKEVLQCNGKCQVTKEILENESADESSSLQINFEKFPTLFIEKYMYAFQEIPLFKKGVLFNWKSTYDGDFKKPLSPPPQSFA